VIQSECNDTEGKEMKILLAYVLVLPLSFLASRLGAVVVGAPIAFALIRASIWLRSTVGGFIACVGGVAAAVAAGWYIFGWIVGPGSFTLAPFIASVFLPGISIPRSYRIAKLQVRTQEEFRESGQMWLAGQLGNPWSTVAGDICGLILATAWFFLK
jgi:hypothetical protein